MPGIKTIYGRGGKPIADIRASVVRSSLLNDIGEAVFNIDTSSVKCREDVLNYGRFLYVEHDSLPAWVGVIDTPRIWHNGYVEVHAFEVPYLLKYRLTTLRTDITGTSGERVSQLIGIANSSADTLIRMGEVFVGGNVTTSSLSDTVYSHIKEIISNNNRDMIFTPTIQSNGNLIISMDWLERAGIITDIELSQGHNILHGDVPLEESGELINSVDAITDPQGENPLATSYSDVASIGAYGLRAARVVYEDTNTLASLLNNATEMVNRQKNPSIATPLTVVDTGSVFDNVRLGNVMTYKYTSIGFNGGGGLGLSQSIRILGYRFDENIGTCELFTGRA